MVSAANIWIYFAVIAAGLTQKHFMVFNKMHFFNPSNFAILIVLIFFHDSAQILLGQLGDALWLMVAVVVVGVFVLIRASRWMIALSFALSYLLFEYLFVVSTDPTMLFEQLTYRFLSISFVVFILFMLTDPRTTPNKWYLQLLFGMLVALFASLLDYIYGFRTQHIFLALALCSVLNPLLMLYNQERLRVRLVIITVTIEALLLCVIYYIQTKSPYFSVMDV